MTRYDAGRLIRDRFGFAAARVEPMLRIRGMPHTQALVREIQAVGDGVNRRLLVMAPPRTGKSLMVSRLACAWYTARHPDRVSAICSHTAGLATMLSRQGRGYYRAMGGRTSGKVTDELWETDEGGYVLARGRGGAFTGHGVSGCLFIDDLVKDREEADSPLIQMRTADWLKSVAFQRLEGPHSSVIAIGTRWSDHDPIGIIFELERAGGVTQNWRILWFDQEYDPRDRNIPDSCTLVPDWREEGELLCPELMPPAEVAQKKALSGSREWASQHQQRPAPRGGLMFKAAWFGILRAVPGTVRRRVRAWDLAKSTSKDADRTAGVRMAEFTTESGAPQWLIEDVVSGKWTPKERHERITATARADGYGVEIVIEQETDGEDRVRQLVAACAPFSAKAIRAKGSKPVRAQGLAAQAEAGNVFLLGGGADWLPGFLDELTMFPVGKHDDRTDAAAHAFNQLAAAPTAEIAESPFAGIW